MERIKNSRFDISLDDAIMGLVIFIVFAFYILIVISPFIIIHNSKPLNQIIISCQNNSNDFREINLDNDKDYWEIRGNRLHVLRGSRNMGKHSDYIFSDWTECEQINITNMGD